jgi:hypothetical protein
MSDLHADGRALFGTVRAALAEALDAVDLTRGDHAAVVLAEKYAHEIDSGGDLVKLGPPYLAALVQLGMTPAARKAITKNGSDDGPRRNPLDELVAKRAARSG